MQHELHGAYDARTIGHSLPVSDLFFAPDDSIYIHPTAVVDPTVKLSPGVRIGPYTLVLGDVTIGAHTKIFGHVAIVPPQDLTAPVPVGPIHIGSHVVIREFATINGPTSADRATIIGDHCYLMHFTHVAHDSHLAHNVIMTNNAQIAGHVRLEEHVLLMAGALVHQRCKIGAYSALGPTAGCRQDLPPYSLFVETPALFAGLNTVRLQRINMPLESQRALKEVTRLFYGENRPLEALFEESKSAPWGADPHVQRFLTFIGESSRGVSRKTVRGSSAE